MTVQPLGLPTRQLEFMIDGAAAIASEGTTILEACRSAGIEIPTLCYLETLTPVNACRVCMVDVAGARTLVPACSARVTEGMDIRTDNERVRHSRKLVFELLASSVDLSLVDDSIRAWMKHYDVDAARFGPGATVSQPAKVQDDLYVRDYAKCILCYKCVAACGVDAQNTFAIEVAGRGFEAHISTEFDVALPESACVYCGNCIGVCPTGALIFKTEFDMRADGSWDAANQTITRTICPYCGVGCNVDLHVQDNRIVKVTSPLDHEVTNGHLCIKGRFGWAHIQEESDGTNSAL